MADLNQVIKGLKKYLDNELLSQVSGLNKWLVGAGLSMALDNGANIFNSLKENSVIKAMDVINTDDEIDVQKLYKYLSEQANKSAVTFAVPLIGSVTLRKADIDKIYQSIMEK